MDGPVLLLTVDALRRDRILSDVFPECQPFFEDFARWTNAYSHGVATPFAFPSILTGEFVEEDGSIPSSAPTLAERLSSRRTVGFGNNPHLIADRGYDRGFDQYHHAAPPDKGGSDVWFDRVKRFARSLPGSGYLNDAVIELQKRRAESDIPSPSYANASQVVNFLERQVERRCSDKAKE